MLGCSQSGKSRVEPILGGNWAHWRSNWVRRGLRRRFPVQVEGGEAVPASGPLLLISSFGSLLDPLLIGAHFPRPIVFFVEPELLERAELGPQLLAVGARACASTPVARTRAIMRAHGAGEAVLILPEKVPSWQGRPGAVGPWLGKLITMLDATVVRIRLPASHLMQPRWATHRRQVPVVMEVQPPVTFPRQAPPLHVAAEIAARIAVDPSDVELPEGSKGQSMAAGLPDYLWACPLCSAMDCMESIAGKDGRKGGDGVPDTRLRCGSCQATWAVDVGLQLVPLDDATPGFGVGEAWDRAVAQYGHPPVADKLDLELHGIALRSAGRVDIRQVDGPLRSEGTAYLHLDRMEIRGWHDEVLLSLSLLEMRRVETTVEGEVRFHLPQGVFALQTRKESALKWATFVERHLRFLRAG
jgi:hypothetical protein